MNNIMQFKNQEFGELTVIEKDDELYFIGKEVAEKLGYTNTRKAILDHVENEEKGVTKWDTPGGAQNIIIINESGFYSLIFSSKLQASKKFKNWVTKEVLPSIRKNGGYITNQENLSNEEILANAVLLANNLILEKNEFKNSVKSILLRKIE